MTLSTLLGCLAIAVGALDGCWLTGRAARRAIRIAGLRPRKPVSARGRILRRLDAMDLALDDLGDDVALLTSQLLRGLDLDGAGTESDLDSIVEDLERGDPRSARAVLDVIDRLEPVASPWEAARHWRLRGLLALISGDPDRAAAAFRSAAEAQPDDRDAWAYIGALARETDPAAARVAADRLLALAGPGGRRWKAAALRDGALLDARENGGTAALESAVRELRAFGRAAETATALFALGELHREDGDLERSLARLEELGELAAQSGRPRLLARALGGLAETFRAARLDRKADRAESRRREILTELGEAPGLRLVVSGETPARLALSHR